MGRGELMPGEGHEGTLQRDGKVLYLGWDRSQIHENVFVENHRYAFKICAYFLCVNYISNFKKCYKNVTHLQVTFLSL